MHTTHWLLVVIAWAVPCARAVHPPPPTPPPTIVPPRLAVGLGELVANSLDCMKRHEWAKALESLKTATDLWGPNAMVLFGPKFGVVWYRRGYCELKLKRYAEAMKSFEICYRDFPNDGGADRENAYHKRALLKWGDASMGVGEYGRLYLELYPESQYAPVIRRACFQ